MRIAIYIRCAYPDRVDFDEQRERCLAYAAQAGHEVVAVYEDYNKSGLDKQRPGLRDMMANAQVGSFEAIVVDRMHRLSRDEVQLHQCFDELSRVHIPVIITEISRTILYSSLSGIAHYLLSFWQDFHDE